ncbi:Heparan-alpha-glucosaminide N-acetyltransferase [Linum grandiflorum]
MRWLGVLQRIAIGYLFASLSEIWLVNNSVVTSVMTFVKKYYVQWMVAFIICAIYMCLLYGLFVPDWRYELQSVNSSGNGSYTQTVHCGVRGSLDPPCNAVGLVDRAFLGLEHLYQHPVYTRTEQCSVNSPDYGPLPPNAPNWCRAPFDPEGILSSMMAAITCFIGLHFGHMLLHVKDNVHRLFVWTATSLSLLIAGYVLVLLGIPLSKPLYTLSYTFVTAGASGLTLAFIFYIVDVKQFRKPGLAMQWMGMNALIVYSLAACEIFPAVLQGFYLFSPKNNLVDGTEWVLQKVLHSQKWGTLAFVMMEILFWSLFSGFLHSKGLYIKL